MLAEYPQFRVAAYTISAAVGLVLGATQVGYAAADAGQPTWLTVALAVYAFIGGSLGVVAKSNTPPAP